MKPSREPIRQSDQTYFVTFQTAQRWPFFRNEQWATLLMETIQKYREEYDLHDFVIMPDHVHLLLTPHKPVERAVQLIKGGYSFTAKRAFAPRREIWQVGFTDHRIRDLEDLQQHIRYIAKNVASLNVADYRFCGVGGAVPLSSALKPL